MNEIRQFQICSNKHETPLVSSKSVEKWGSNGHLKNSKWPTFSRHFEYSISFQNFFNCLIFYQYLSHHLCFSRYVALYTKKMFY